MFCPVCKAEYRFGFTHCSDCDVDLVETLDSSADSDAAQSGQREAADLDTPELLWTGIDSGAFARIRAALDEAHIPYGNEPVEARLLYASLRNPLEIWIRRADRDGARKILAGQFGAQSFEDVPEVVDGNPPMGTSLSEEIGLQRLSPGKTFPRSAAVSQTPTESEESVEATLPNLLENFDAEEATAEIWSGEDRDVARFLHDSLRENGIGCKLGEVAVGQLKLFVYPADHTRASEIVREIIEGVPPE
jgi:hypothetical protein